MTKVNATNKKNKPIQRIDPPPPPHLPFVSFIFNVTNMNLLKIGSVVKEDFKNSLSTFCHSTNKSSPSVEDNFSYLRV